MSKNPYDKQIEEFASLFRAIPNFNKIGEVPLMAKLFDSLSAKMIQISNLRGLFKDFYCPAADDYIKKQKKLALQSKYLKLHKEVVDEIEDTHYATIRMGYVQLFHHIEGFINKLFDQTNELCKEEEFITIEEYFLKNYNFIIRKHWRRMCDIVEKANWICNRIKHNDGFPNNDINRWPIYFLLKVPDFQFNEKQRIRIELNEFEDDVNEIINFLSTISFIVLKTYIIMLSDKFLKLITIVPEKVSIDIDNSKKLLLESQQGLINEINQIISMYRKIGIEDN